MRILLIAIGAILVGGGVGVASGYLSAGPSQSASAIASLRGENFERSEFPEFRIDKTSYDFGIMQRGSSLSHKFKVTNAGGAPLQVNVLSTTCKCTVGNVGNGLIQPGETEEVELSWVAKSNPGQFRQTATLSTTDPRASRVELTVEGEVIEASGIEPKEWIFNQLRAGDERTASIYVMAFQSESIQVKSATLDGDRSADHYNIEIVDVPVEELPDPKAKAGVRIDLTPLPALPQGPIYDWVVVETDLPDVEPLRVPVFGSVVGDIDIRGPAGWNENIGAIHFGDVLSSEGAEMKLLLSVGGEHAKDIEFEVAEVEPSELEIEVGEANHLASGTTHVPLTVRIPKGLPPAIRNGSGQGEAGKVLLKTNHPLSPELKFEVRYILRRDKVTR